MMAILFKTLCFLYDICSLIISNKVNFWRTYNINNRLMSLKKYNSCDPTHYEEF